MNSYNFGLLESDNLYYFRHMTSATGPKIASHKFSLVWFILMRKEGSNMMNQTYEHDEPDLSFTKERLYFGNLIISHNF